MPRRRFEYRWVAFNRTPLIAAFLLLVGVVVLLLAPATKSSTTPRDTPLASQTRATQIPNFLHYGKWPLYLVYFPV